MLCILYTNTWVIFFPLPPSLPNRLHLLMINLDLYMPRFEHKNIFLLTFLDVEGKSSSNPTSKFSLLQVRPNAVALVDAFNYTDHYLGSILGRYDGNVYPKLYDEAWKDPMNDTAVPDGYHEYIRPLLKQQLRNSRL